MFVSDPRPLTKEKKKNFFLQSQNGNSWRSWRIQKPWKERKPSWNATSVILRQTSFGWGKERYVLVIKFLIISLWGWLYGSSVSLSMIWFITFKNLSMLSLKFLCLLLLLLLLLLFPSLYSILSILLPATLNNSEMTAKVNVIYSLTHSVPLNNSKVTIYNCYN